jgi:hypothetical protein
MDGQTSIGDPRRWMDNLRQMTDEYGDRREITAYELRSWESVSHRAGNKFEKLESSAREYNPSWFGAKIGTSVAWIV